LAEALAKKMQAGRDSGVFPGAVLLIALKGKVVFHEAFGKAQITPKAVGMTCETCFDLASLTKPIAAATALALLQGRGEIDLQTPLSVFFPHFSEGRKDELCIVHLLNHTSGLPPWRPYFEAVLKREQEERGFLGSPEAKQMVYQMAREEPLIAAPGTQALYSDIGFILLAELIERVSGMALGQFCHSQLFSKIKPEAPFFRLAGEAEDTRRSFAATEDVPWRGGAICGEVHDDNAYAMGGVSGHAGLFSTAFGLFQAVWLWVKSIRGGGLLDPKITRQYIRRQAEDQGPEGSSWGLGWDTPSSSSSSGRFFSRSSFGHLGFTGTSIWVDPEKELIVLLLTNRVHPSRKNEAIRGFRPELHDLVFQEFIGGG